MQILNEMYFGKVIVLQQLEDVFNKLKSKYKSDGKRNPRLIYKEINRDDLTKKIGQYIKEQFGFGEVIVTISMSQKMNASTISFLADKHGIAYADDLKGISLKDALVVTREGIRYDTTKFAPSILIVISMGLLFSSYVTTEELVAALLHEIGHSFSKATIGSSNFNSRIDEKFADQFATMFGYGPDLAKVLSKISFHSQHSETSTLSKIPILNVFVGLNNIRKSLIARAISGNEHPTIFRRMNDTIRQLEVELQRADNLTSKQRAELKANIEVLKAETKKYFLDSSTLSDKVFKFYEKNIEHRLGKERNADHHADLYGSSDLVDQELRKRI